MVHQATHRPTKKEEYLEAFARNLDKEGGPGNRQEATLMSTWDQNQSIKLEKN